LRPRLEEPQLFYPCPLPAQLDLENEDRKVPEAIKERHEIFGSPGEVQHAGWRRQDSRAFGHVSPLNSLKKESVEQCFGKSNSLAPIQNGGSLSGKLNHPTSGRSPINRSGRQRVCLW
jgi:hypothetical protein